MEFMNRIKDDTSLVKCILSQREDFKEYVPTEDEIDNLIWDRVFPCQYTVDTTQTAKCFITMRFKYGASSKSPIWKNGLITFYLFCHKDIVKTSYNILRYDYMLQRINELIFDTRNANWIGKMEFHSVEEILIGDGNYVGVCVTYRNTELM